MAFISLFRKYPEVKSQIDIQILNSINIIKCVITMLSTSFRKSFFCLALYTEEVNLQTFVMIICKTICRNYLCTKSFILVTGFKNIFAFSRSKKRMQIMPKSAGQVTWRQNFNMFCVFNFSEILSLLL